MEPFNADPINLDNWDPILEVRKKPIIVHALQLNFPEGFKVTTMEGSLLGKAGDYLMIGVHGEKYPIDRLVFDETHDVIGISGKSKHRRSNMATATSLERAAQAWCTPETEKITIDPILAKAFADILDEVKREGMDTKS